MRLTGVKLEAGQKKISTYIHKMLDGSCCSKIIDYLPESLIVFNLTLS